MAQFGVGLVLKVSLAVQERRSGKHKTSVLPRPCLDKTLSASVVYIIGHRMPFGLSVFV